MKCSRCNSPNAFQCDVCGRTVKERGVAGVVPPAALATYPDPTKFLRGDGTWQVAGGGEGMPGPTGDIGPQGYPGNPGPTGDMGLQGITGDIGPQGPPGEGGAGGSIVAGYNFVAGKLYYEGFEEPYIWIPTDKHLYVDVDTGELFLEA